MNELIKATNGSGKQKTVYFFLPVGLITFLALYMWNGLDKAQTAITLLDKRATLAEMSVTATKEELYKVSTQLDRIEKLLIEKRIIKP